MPKSSISPLKGRSNFKQMSKEKASYVTSRLVFVRRYSNVPSIRVGIIATRKLGNAVVRNKARRRIRESFRLFFAEEKFTNIDLIVILRKRIINSSNDEIKNDIFKTLKKILRPE